MKKSLLQLTGFLAVSAMLWGIANAQLDISDLFSNWDPLVNDAYVKVLNGYDKTRWYTDDITTCDSKNAGSISITSPALDDADYYKVKSYRLFLSPYRIDELKSGNPSIDTSKVIIKESNIVDDTSEVNFTITSSDVNPGTAYYGFVLPINDFDFIWTPSKEICFQLDKNICMQDSSCDTFDLVINPVETHEVQDSENSHGASCVGMDMANVTHSINGDTINLKWTAVDWDVVEIGIFDPEAEEYKNLGAVNMKDENFSYKMQWTGEQNFLLTNGCRDLHYKADRIIKEWEPEKIVAPATWPAENIIYIAIAAIILYGVYVVFFRKADNK